MEKEYVIGVDCGGTHSEGYVYDLSGKELYHFHGGQANLIANASQAFKNVSQILCQIFKSVKKENCKLILIGFAGLGIFGQQERIIKKLHLENMNVHLVSDADIALINVLRGQDGLLVIAGTGSVVLGQRKTHKIRIGGWGHLLGDEGGGYYLGRQAFKQVTNEYDNGKLSQFSLNFMKHLKEKDVFSVVSNFYSKNKSEVGQQALFIAQCAKHGDPIAQQLIKNAAIRLSEQINLGISRLNVQGTIQIGLSGSLIEKNELYAATLKQQIKATHDNVRFVRAVNGQNNAKAAFYVYQNKL